MSGRIFQGGRRRSGGSLDLGLGCLRVLDGGLDDGDLGMVGRALLVDLFDGDRWKIGGWKYRFVMGFVALVL